MRDQIPKHRIKEQNHNKFAVLNTITEQCEHKKMFVVPFDLSLRFIAWLGAPSRWQVQRGQT